MKLPTPEERRERDEYIQRIVEMVGEVRSLRDPHRAAPSADRRGGVLRGVGTAQDETPDGRYFREICVMLMKYDDRIGVMRIVDLMTEVRAALAWPWRRGWADDGVRFGRTDGRGL